MKVPHMTTPRIGVPRWIALLAIAAMMGTVFGRADEPTPSSPARPLEAKGVANLFRLTDHVYSGGEPQGADGFAALQRLGVRTVLSVDGTRTDAETARRFGMRYVHIPIGYDGIDETHALRIVKTAESLPGPVFIHCHHGQHRGPTAAAIVCLADGKWNHEQAVAWMKQAGTSADYAGLYRTVREFSAPTPERLAAVPNEFPEHAAVPPLVETMTAIDHLWDHMIALHDAGWTISADQPKLDPPHDALLLVEQFRELSRTSPRAMQDDDFRRRLTTATTASSRLEAVLRQLALQSTAPLRRDAEQAYRAVKDSCKQCHQKYRDNGDRP